LQQSELVTKGKLYKAISPLMPQVRIPQMIKLLLR